MRTLRMAGLVLAFTLAATACGGDHDDQSHASDGTAVHDPSDGDGDGGHSAAPVSPDDADRVVEVVMVDNRFEPNDLDLEVGETVTFRFVNDGLAVHEAVIGDEHIQDEHAVDMAEGDAHDHDHGAIAVTVEPGETAELTMTFDTPGTLLIGCHEPGHWEDGMKATITVR